MRTDLKYKLSISALIALIPLVIVSIVLFLILTNSLWLGLFPVYLMIGAFLITFILGFVPFMKDHMLLSVAASSVLALLAAFILHLVI